jgi:hypothetical protein
MDVIAPKLDRYSNHGSHQALAFRIATVVRRALISAWYPQSITGLQLKYGLHVKYGLHWNGASCGSVGIVFQTLIL